MDTSYKKTKRMAFLGMLLGLCIVGSQLQILGSISFDSFGAYLGALLLGPSYGAVLGAIGHMLAALLAGFPLSLPIHCIVAVLMAIACYAFGWSYRFFIGRMESPQKHWFALIFSVALAYFFNVIVGLFILYPFLKGLVYALFIPLTIAALSNIGMAVLIFQCIPSGMKRQCIILFQHGVSDKTV